MWSATVDREARAIRRGSYDRQSRTEQLGLPPQQMVFPPHAGYARGFVPGIEDSRRKSFWPVQTRDLGAARQLDCKCDARQSKGRWHLLDRRLGVGHRRELISPVTSDQRAQSRGSWLAQPINPARPCRRDHEMDWFDVSHASLDERQNEATRTIRH